MKKQKKVVKPKKTAPLPLDEWDLSADFGGIPKDIHLTQNIGCGGAINKKPKP